MTSSAMLGHRLKSVETASTGLLGGGKRGRKELGVSENAFYECIIVGGGSGGLTAGMYAVRAALKTVCIKKGVPGDQVAITKGLENFPEFMEFSGFEFCDKFLEHAKW
jgi:alkyl hydroperoxide reductase subunit AhpF